MAYIIYQSIYTYINVYISVQVKERITFKLYAVTTKILLILKLTPLPNSGLILGLCPANERWRYFVLTVCDVTLQWHHMAFYITSDLTVWSTACHVQQQRKWHRSPLRPFVRGNHQWPAYSSHTGSVMWKTFSCHEVIMYVSTLFVHDVSSQNKILSRFIFGWFSILYLITSNFCQIVFRCTTYHLKIA